MLAVEGTIVADRGRHTWQTPEMTELFDAIARLESTEEGAVFCRDLCTLAELEAMAARRQVGPLLGLGLRYVETAQRTGASTTTVTRVAHWLRHGEGGYRLALDRLTEMPAKRTYGRRPAK